MAIPSTAARHWEQHKDQYLRNAVALADEIGQREARREPKADEFQVRSRAVWRAYLAHRSYKPERLGLWKNHLKQGIRYGVNEGLRGKFRPGKQKFYQEFHQQFEVVPLDDRAFANDGDETHADQFPDHRPHFARQIEAMDYLRPALAALTDRQLAVIVGIYFHGKTRGELAREFGVGPETVSGWERKALDLLRKSLDPDYCPARPKLRTADLGIPVDDLPRYEDRLTATQFEILKLHYLEGKSLRQIAKDQGKSKSSVQESRLGALARLGKILAEEACHAS